MKDENVLKWIPLNTKMLKKIVRIKQTIGKYSIVQLSNYDKAIVDRKNLKILVSSQRWYTISPDWDAWIKRGFIVVIMYNKGIYNYDHYIFKGKDKSRIGNKVYYYAEEFLVGKSDYFKITSKENGIFKHAIFDKDGNQVSDWYDDIEEEGLVKGKSDYYIATKNDKAAIFDKNGNQVSDWYDNILPDGLVKGQSDYYIVARNGKDAIFHKDGRQISDWFDNIEIDGVIDTDYYIAKKNGKEAIFHRNGQQISEWFDEIYSSDLFWDLSDYYIVKQNGKETIFHRNGKQITDWFDEYYTGGLVRGTSEYYVIKRNKLLYICKLKSSRELGPFESLQNPGFISDDSNQEAVEVTTTTHQEITLTKQEVEQFFEEKEVEDEK
jgi:phage anti-repressor protein